VTEAGWLACAWPKTLVDHLRENTPRGAKHGYQRKFRLFSCACCRRIWEVLPEGACREAVEVAEQVADGLAAGAELAAVLRAARRVERRHIYRANRARNSADLREWAAARAAMEACFAATRAAAARPAAAAAESLFAYNAAGYADVERLLAQPSRNPALAEGIMAEGIRTCDRTGAQTRERRAHVALLHSIFGNPFRPVALDPAWRTGDVLALARAAYAERRLPGGELDPARLLILADALEDAGCASPAILGHLRGPGQHVRGDWVVDLGRG
jgi:hypothetical protein